MDILVTKELLNIIMISITFSIILMAVIQKFKKLPFINKSYKVWILNFIFAFLIGVPFSMWFYKLSIYDSLWVGLFAFVGAPSIYKALKEQNIINYTPESISDTIEVPKENEIPRA